MQYEASGGVTAQFWANYLEGAAALAPDVEGGRGAQSRPIYWRLAPGRPNPASFSPLSGPWAPSRSPLLLTHGPGGGALSRHRHIRVEKLAAGIVASHLLQHHSGRLSVDAQIVKLKPSGCPAERAPSWDRPRDHVQDGIPGVVKLHMARVKKQPGTFALKPRYAEREGRSPPSHCRHIFF